MKFIPVFLVFLFSCTPTSFDSKDEYMKWLFSEESGFNSVSTADDLSFRLTYIPEQLLYKDTIMDNNLQFQFRVYPNNSENLLRYGLADEADYSKRIAFLEFKMGELFSLTHSDNDTIRSSFSHYENFRGIKNEILVHVHFTIKNEEQQDLIVHYQDKIFGTGLHHFKFKSATINNPPTLIHQPEN